MKSRRLNRKIPDNVSKTHKELFYLISKLFPCSKVYLEYPLSKIYEIYCKRNKIDADPLIVKQIQNLHLDIYDSTYQVGFEIQGQQHSSFNRFFHKSHIDFDRQVRNDKTKRVFCTCVGIKLIEIKIGDLLTLEKLLKCYCDDL